MTCERCGGLSIVMRFGDGFAWEYDGWRCMNCGNVIDPLIQSNRDVQAHRGIGRMTKPGMQSARGAVGSGQPLRVPRS